MKRLPLSICLCLIALVPLNVLAQSADTRIEQMMTKRSLTAVDVSYNIASMAPGLYKAGKIDTLRQFIDYYERNYGAAVTITPLKLLLDIKDRSFREEMTPPRRLSLTESDSSYYAKNILSLLRNFNNVCSTLVAGNGYTDDINQVYRPYWGFIGSLAGELKTTPGLSPAEIFLTNYFARPAKDSLKSLGNHRYDGTRIQRAWLAEQAQIERVSGLSAGVITGVWVPTGNLSLLGPHPYVGCLVGGRGNKFSVEANLNFRFLHSAHPYVVVEKQITYNTTYYFGGYIGVDGMYELAKKHKRGLELLGGVAWDGMDALKSDPKNNDAPTKSINSLNINLGFGYRWYLTRRNVIATNMWGFREAQHRVSYLAVQTKYNFINYSNDGGTPMDGHGLTFGVIYGGYSRRLSTRQ